MNRRVLISLGVLIVALVIAGIVLANIGNGGGSHPPAANKTSTPPTSSTTTSTPSQPSACTLLSTATITKALHVSPRPGVVTGPAGSRECTWHGNGGGTVVTLSVVNSGDQLVLALLGNNITGKVHGMGGYAVFAPSPPRLALDVGSGVLVSLGPDGYKPLLPKGTTNPRKIAKSTVLPPLETLVKAAAAALK